MLIPPPPHDEALRLRALHGSELLFSPAEARFDRITEMAGRAFDAPVAALSLVAESCQWFKSMQGAMLAPTPRSISFCSHALLSHDTLVVSDALHDERFSDNPLVSGPPHLRFYAGHPVRYRRQPIGTLCVLDTRPRLPTAEQLAQLRSLAAWVEDEIGAAGLSAAQRDLIGTHDPVQRQLLIDPLTRIWNRRAADVLLPQELRRARTGAQPVAALLVDIDRFSCINERFGRAAGDVLLSEVARRVRRAVRPFDALIRHAGKQFLLVVAGTTPEAAAALGERVLAQVAMLPFPMGGAEIDVSVSIGVAALARADEGQASALVAAAESALRAAKTDGRGCVRLRLLSPGATAAGNRVDPRQGSR